jgi:hypothetical protein
MRLIPRHDSLSVGASVISLMALVALAGCAGNPPAADVNSVRVALAQQYPYSDEWHDEDLQFEPAQPVKSIELPALAKALPDVRFFRTELRTRYFEYPEVEVAIAAPRQGAIAMYLSPTYDTSKPAFVERLLQARVQGEAEKQAVGQDISRIFAKITYAGEIRSPRHEGDRFSAELWHGELYWRLITVTYADGRIMSVTLTNPRDVATQPVAPTTRPLPAPQ